MTLQWFRDNNIDINDSIGIDEVGRGPLAGPVVSAAVWISKNCAQKLESISDALPVRDSKKLSRRQRQKVISWISKISSDNIKYAIGLASVEEIDEMNILQAAMLSMQRAYKNLALPTKTNVLVDGNTAPNLSNENASGVVSCIQKQKQIQTIIKGDAKVLPISLASIIAKEYRDALMIELGEKYPQYGWKTNVGYGTKIHLRAISEFGITPQHRKSFAPIREAFLKANN